MSPRGWSHAVGREWSWRARNNPPGKQAPHDTCTLDTRACHRRLRRTRWHRAVNRDFLRALADVGAVTSTLVLPRHTIDAVAALPSNIRQLPPHPSRIGYSVAALWTAPLRQRVDIVFCGHAYMMPLALLIARLTRAKLIVIVHGIEGWSRPSWLCQRAIEAADMVLLAPPGTHEIVFFAGPPSRPNAS